MPNIDKVLEHLQPPIPVHYTAGERDHAKALLSDLIRQRVVDNAAWSLTLQYARHRAEWDRLDAEIDAARALSPDPPDTYFGAQEQGRAYCEKRCLEILKQLTATPYARAKSGDSRQSDFLDELDRDQEPQGNVAKFQPRRA